MKLYEIAQNHEILMGMIESGAAVEATLEALEWSFEEKAENCMKLYRNLIAQRDACKEEAKRLNDRAASYEKEAESLKRYVEGCMMRMGVDKLKTPLFTLWIQGNAPSVEITDQTHIPEQYWKPQDPVLNKAAIKEALEANIPVPGAQLKQTHSLRMR